MSFAQNHTSSEQKPYIEVTGKAEKKIIPDEIYLSITIKERTSGKDEISVEEQEIKLRQALTDLNIPLDLLAVADAQADYIKVKWTKKDVISQSEYELKLTSAKQVAAVFSKLDEIKIDNAYISKVSHSKIKELRKEVNIEAIKNAKSKADYLLAAIGQQTGTALIINERNSESGDYYRIENRLKTSANFSRETAALNEKSIGAIVFKKIKLEALIYVKFEIKDIK
jgi:nicotinamide mononucleotide adenylyltransferase